MYNARETRLNSRSRIRSRRVSKHGRNIDTNLHFRSRENGVTGVNERIVGTNEEGKNEGRKRRKRKRD